MPKYRVHICRIAYSHLDIEAEGTTKKKAEEKALEDAGNHLFPTEHTSDYSVEGSTLIE